MVEDLGERGGRRFPVNSLIAMAVVAILLFSAMAFWGDFSQVFDHARKISLRALSGAFALATGNYVLRWIRWEIYLRRLHIDISRWVSLQIFVAGFVMSITPGKLGETLKAWMLRQECGVSLAHSAPIVLVERFMDFAALASLALWVFLPSWLALVLIICGFVFLGFFVTIPAGDEVILRRMERGRRTQRVAVEIRRALHVSQSMLFPRVLIWTVPLSLIAWWFECVALGVVATALGVHLDSSEMIAVYAGSTFFGALTMLPGGLFTTEATMVGALVRGHQVVDSVAVAITILVRIATLWWAVLLGAIAYVSFAIRRRKT